MSSNEDEYHDKNHFAKKRRIQRACDVCRRKKIRCDGGRMYGDKCISCSTYRFECTYVEAAKKRGPNKGYVERLENYLGKLEDILNQICPDRRAAKASEDDIWAANLPSTSSLQPLPAASDVATSIIRNAKNLKFTSLDLNANGDAKPPGNNNHDEIVLGVSTMAIRTVEPIADSRRADLIHVAYQIKSAYTGLDSDALNSRRKERREEFWSVRPWEINPEGSRKTRYTFPHPDLLDSLIHHYFSSVNIFLPLLHRPTFERSIAMRVHHTDDDFAAIVLLVCALGARYSNDPRVKMDGIDAWQSSGWRWYNQVDAYRRLHHDVVGSPILYDLQFYCLAALFLHGATISHACWMMIGNGVRLAQAADAHRRKKNTTNITVEDEMWKRMFWVLVCLDLMTSVGLGRPCAIQDEDLDLDYPIECDDEYWFTLEKDEEGSKPFPASFLQQPVVFKQPSDKPSLITAFVLSLKLNKVVAVLVRTIYSLKKNRVLLGFIGEHWEQHIVSELDSALNQWVDSVPDHLRWDPHREHPQFFEQSALIYSNYYHVQILIHQPFIPTPNKPSSTNFPSLAICTNAARSCSHVLDAQCKRGLGALPQLQMSAFTAAIVLLLYIWSGKRHGMAVDSVKEMVDVSRCINVLKSCESRWNCGGRMSDIIRELAFVGDLPLSLPPPAGNKRGRDADHPASETSAHPTMLSFPPEQQVPADVLPRTIAGSRRVNRVSLQQQHGQDLHRHERFEPTPPRLPVYTSELGKASSSSSPQFYTDTSSVYWFQGGPRPSSSSMGRSTIRIGQTFAEHMEPSRRDTGVPSAHPAVPDTMGSYVSVGGAREPHRPVHSSMQSYPAVVPSSSSSYHFGVGFFDSPGFGVRGAAPAPVAGDYDGGMVNSSSMDTDLQALMNNDLYGMSSNASWGFDSEFPKDFDDISYMVSS